MSHRAIFVSGANGGIGFSIVRQLLAKPIETVALVVAVDLYNNHLRTLLPQYSDRLEIITGDISERIISKKGIDAAISRVGHLDSIILNAGVQGPVGSLQDVDVEAWKKCFDINFFSLIHTIQVAAPHLKKSKGSIIMTTSGISLGPFPELGAYGSSKAAMNYLNLCWQKEDHDIRSVCIRPGIVDTGMQNDVRNEFRDVLPKMTYDWLKRVYDRGELLKPEQPAKTFVQFAVYGIPNDMKSTIVDWNDDGIIFN
ncbi:hypothetical protein F5884DRAFT_878764 [Xylogone sp. PMI_703]|nr:hypothetical protein F5884DRAFT_878764 [Xylogone sp. PMI_703]